MPPTFPLYMKSSLEECWCGCTRGVTQQGCYLPAIHEGWERAERRMRLFGRTWGLELWVRTSGLQDPSIGNKRTEARYWFPLGWHSRLYGGAKLFLQILKIVGINIPVTGWEWYIAGSECREGTQKHLWAVSSLLFLVCNRDPANHLPVSNLAAFSALLPE